MKFSSRPMNVADFRKQILTLNPRFQLLVSRTKCLFKIFESSNFLAINWLIKQLLNGPKQLDTTTMSDQQRWLNTHFRYKNLVIFLVTTNKIKILWIEMFRYLLSAKQNGLCYDLQKNGLCCNFFLFTLCKTTFPGYLYNRRN